MDDIGPARSFDPVEHAGSEPVDKINSAVVEVMSELGLDVSKEFPKPLTDEVLLEYVELLGSCTTTEILEELLLVTQRI